MFQRRLNEITILKNEACWFWIIFYSQKKPVVFTPYRKSNNWQIPAQVIQNDEMIVYRSKNKTLKLKIKISRISRDRGGWPKAIKESLLPGQTQTLGRCRLDISRSRKTLTWCHVPQPGIGQCCGRLTFSW